MAPPKSRKREIEPKTNIFGCTPSFVITLSIAYSAFSGVMGLMIFLTFGWTWHNYSCAVWGLLAGCAAFGYSLFSYYVYKKYARPWEMLEMLDDEASLLNENEEANEGEDHAPGHIQEGVPVSVNEVPMEIDDDFGDDLEAGDDFSSALSQPTPSGSYDDVGANKDNMIGQAEGLADTTAADLAQQHGDRLTLVLVVKMIAKFGMAVSLGGFVGYIAFAALDGEKVTGHSHWVTAVWAFMTFKWCFALWHRATVYWRKYRSVYFELAETKSSGEFSFLL